MSSHYIYVACITEGCTSHESIYTGEAYTELFDDSGPDSWEGETIRVRCKECQEGVTS